MLPGTSFVCLRAGRSTGVDKLVFSLLEASMSGHEANRLRACCYLLLTGYATSVSDLAGCITRAGGELRLTPLYRTLCLLSCLLPATESILTIALARGWVMACLPSRLSRTLTILFWYGGVKADRGLCGTPSLLDLFASRCTRSRLNGSTPALFSSLQRAAMTWMKSKLLNRRSR